MYLIGKQAFRPGPNLQSCSQVHDRAFASALSIQSLRHRYGVNHIGEQVQIKHIELISELCLNDSEITFDMWSCELNHHTTAANRDDKAHDVFCELQWLGDEYPPVRFIAEIRSVPESGKWSTRFSEGGLDFNSSDWCLMTEIGNGVLLEQSVEILKDVYCAPPRDKKRVLLQGLNQDHG